MRVPIHHLFALSIALLPAFANGQTPRSPTPACDSLLITSLQWAPFSDTALELHVFNYSTTLFDYPGFLLYDQNADTVAKEEVYYFGLPLESDHLLTVHQGTVIQSGPFFGSLELWTGFYASQACVKNAYYDLCPSSPCISLSPYLINYGAPVVNTTLNWNITDALNNNVGIGTFFLNGGQQSAQGTLCLAPGHYTLHVSYSGSLTAQLHYGLTTGNMISQMPETLFVSGVVNDMPFTFFGPCMPGGNGIAETHAPTLLHWRIEDDRLIVDTGDGTSIGAYDLIDAIGRTVQHGSSPSTTTTIAIGGFASGAYVLNTVRHGAVRITR